jgi:hypothetical protein
MDAIFFIYTHLIIYLSRRITVERLAHEPTRPRKWKINHFTKDSAAAVPELLLE